MEAAAAFAKRLTKKDTQAEAVELNNIGKVASFSKEPFASTAQRVDEESFVDTEKIKNRVFNVWNNVKYGRGACRAGSCSFVVPDWGT